jgi:hypothetical protein
MNKTDNYLDKHRDLIFLILVILLILSYYFPIHLENFIKYDLVSRNIPVLAGTASIFTLKIASSSTQYLFKENDLRQYLLTLLLAGLVVMITGQRSLLLALLLSIIYVLYRKHRVILFLFLTSIPIFVSNWFLVARYGAGYEGGDYIDTFRIEILHEFILELMNNPMGVFIGLGIEDWTSSIHSQEPHFQFFHLISDYGIFVAIVFSFAVYGGFTFQIFNRYNVKRTFSILVLCGVAPYYLFHTYSLERGNILLFMILSFYFIGENLNLQLYLKKLQVKRHI